MESLTPVNEDTVERLAGLWKAGKRRAIMRALIMTPDPSSGAKLALLLRERLAERYGERTAQSFARAICR